jgi:hypothetical protein
VTPPPLVFGVLGFDTSSVWPMKSWLVKSHHDRSTADHCVDCQASQSTVFESSFHGFDDYLEIPADFRGFMPNHEHLVVVAALATEVCSVVSGLEPVPVSFTDWNQSSVATPSGAPALRELAVVGQTVGAQWLRKPNGSSAHALPTCTACGALRRPTGFEGTASRFRPRLDAWDGSDIFRVRGLRHVFVTEPGRQRLARLGLTNLRLGPTRWWS